MRAKTLIWIIMIFSLTLFVHADLTENLTLYYKFDSDATDSTLNGFDGVAVGVVLDNINYKLGGGSYEFNASENDSISFASALAVLRTANTGTVCMWLDADVVNAGVMWSVSQGATTNYYVITQQDAATSDTRVNSYTTSTRFIKSTNQSNLNAGTWYFYCFTHDGTETYLYINASLVAQAYDDTTEKGVWWSDLGANLQYALIGQMRWNNADSFKYDGHIDEVAVWVNRSLNITEITELYNGGNGQQYPFGAVDNFSITAYDLLNYTQILNFTALLNGTVYSTNIGEITTPYIVNESHIFEINFSVPGYADKSYNVVNSSLDFRGNLTPFLRINATNATYGTYLSVFNATVNGTDYNTSSGEIITNIPRNASIAVNVTVMADEFYYGRYLNVNYSNLRANLSRPFQVFAFNSLENTTITTFTVNVSNGSFSWQGSTADGSEYVHGGLDGYYNVTVSSPGSYTTNTTEYNLTLETNVTFYLWRFNSFYVFIRDEITRGLINDRNISVSIISDVYASNHSTENGTLYVYSYVPATYELRYSAQGYDTRSYFITVQNDTYNNLTLFLLEENNATLILVYVTDEGGNEVEGSYVKALRQYIIDDEASYQVVEMARTNFYGQGGLHLARYNTYYRFLVELDDMTYLYTEPTLIYDTTIYARINTVGDILESWKRIDDVDANMYFDNATSRFIYVWSDTSGLVRTGCINVTRRTAFGEFQICDSCIDSAAGTLYCTINKNLTGTFLAAALIDTETANSWYTVDIDEFQDDSTGRTLNLEGAAWTVILTSTAAIVGAIAFAAPGAIMGSVLTFVGCGIIKLILVSYESAITLILLGGILSFMCKK